MSGRSPKWDKPFFADFSDYSWAEIITKCKRKQIPPNWKIADQKAMTINGTEYLIDIIGFNHDNYADGSGKAPITFQLHEVYGTRKRMNTTETNAGGWAECEMRTTYLPEILALMPTEVQAAIREVNKLTSAGKKSTTINTTADKLFLLSEVETYGSVTNSAAGEGTQYAYYQAGGSKIKYDVGTGKAKQYWERSPGMAGNTYFCEVDANGAASYLVSTGTVCSEAFAFCF